jgi:hypothetical protein
MKIISSLTIFLIATFIASIAAASSDALITTSGWIPSVVVSQGPRLLQSNTLGDDFGFARPGDVLDYGPTNAAFGFAAPSNAFGYFAPGVAYSYLIPGGAYSLPFGDYTNYWTAGDAYFTGLGSSGSTGSDDSGAAWSPYWLPSSAFVVAPPRSLLYQPAAILSNSHVGDAYDPDVMAVVSGKIVALQSGDGVAAVLATSGGRSFTVDLAPAWFLKQASFALQPGDNVTVLGSFVTGKSGPYVIARNVQKNGVALELRGEDGTPIWNVSARP